MIANVARSSQSLKWSCLLAYMYTSISFRLMRLQIAVAVSVAGDWRKPAGVASFCVVIATDSELDQVGSISKTR